MRFGIELEVIGVAGPAHQAITAAGVDCRNLTNTPVWQTKSATPYWKLVYDGSVPGGFEVVGPPLESTNEEHLAQIRKVCAALQSTGCTVNRTCGFHVHVDVAGLQLNQFKSLIKLFAKFEGAFDLMMPTSRRGNNNNFCYSIVDPYIGSLERFFGKVNNATTIQRLHSLIRGGSKYVKLNLTPYFRQETVEFRHHSGTINAEKVIHWVELCVALVAAAKVQKAVSAKGRKDPEALFYAIYKGAQGSLYKRLHKFYRKRLKERNPGLENEPQGFALAA